MCKNFYFRNKNLFRETNFYFRNKNLFRETKIYFVKQKFIS